MPTVMQIFSKRLIGILFLTLVFSACSAVTPTVTIQVPLQTPFPTYTPLATYTPFPTYTPYPTYTPFPTFTRVPTFTPTQGPTSTPTLPAEFVETVSAADFHSCSDRSGPRQKVRVENITGGDATLYLYGPENYLCTIPPRTTQIYVVNGDYDLSAHMCGGNLYNFGNHIINPTWIITLKCP